MQTPAYAQMENPPTAHGDSAAVHNNDLSGIATLTHDPLATYDIHGRVTKKGSRK